jgi:hypothetical protein
MPGMFEIMLIIGIIYNALQITFIIPYNKLNAKNVFVVIHYCGETIINYFVTYFLYALIPTNSPPSFASLRIPPLCFATRGKTLPYHTKPKDYLG